MMASKEKKLETTSDILRMGKKRISDDWNNSRGWYEARTTNLREEGQGLEERLIFDLQKTTGNTTKITEILRENEKQRGSANNEKNLKTILEMASDWWNSFLRQTRKELGMAPE